MASIVTFFTNLNFRKLLTDFKLQNINFYIFVASDHQSFNYQNAKVVGLFWGKILLFAPLGIQIETHFHFTNTRIELHLLTQFQNDMWTTKI